MLLWVLVLSLFAAAVALFSRSMPEDFRANVLAVQSWIAAAFILFILLTSNPFARVAEANALGRDRVSALMTTTKLSLGRVRDIVDEYLAQGFRGIFLRPMSPYGFAVKTKWFKAYDADEWLAFYFAGLEYILALNRSGYAFTEFYAATILAKMLTPFEPGFVDLRSPAGIGIAAIVYNYDGEVYASDESRMLAEMGDTTFRIGNVHRDRYEDIILSDALLRPIEEFFRSLRADVLRLRV